MAANGSIHYQRVFVVLNPVAGTSTAADVHQALERHFTSAGIAYDIYETTGQEHVPQIVQEALQRGYDLFVVAGGDGTVSDVAQGVARSDVPLGIIPIGTANVLARELGLPLDLDGACALLAGDNVTANIDAMRVGDKLFVLQIGIGIDALMIRDTDREAKRRFGRLAYIWTALSWLVGYQPNRFNLVVDGMRMRMAAAQVLIANGGILGMPPFRWGPDIYPNDGAIDICVVNARSLGDYLSIAWHTLLGQQRRNRKLRYLQAREFVSVNARRPLPAQGDGEIIGTTPIRVDVLPGVVQVVVPPANPLQDEHPDESKPMTQESKKSLFNLGLPDQPDAESREPVTEPSPEAKAAAEPARVALKEALAQIKTPEQAREVAERIMAIAANGTELETREKAGAAPMPGAQVAATEQSTPPGPERVAATLIEAARQVAGSSGEMREALEQVLQQATRTTEAGGDPEIEPQRDLLRDEIIKRMQPFQAIDTRLFLAINHLPHPPLVNWLMNGITIVMNAGWGWVIGLMAAALFDRPRGPRAFHQVVPPLWFATMAVEYPVKGFFRRRRPFIDVVQSIAVGRKPGTYSFPSGHSASAFAGAWLLCQHYPKLAPLWYTIATLVGFSRIYVGAHYPGDVLSGAIAGTAIAEGSRWFIARADAMAEEGAAEPVRSE